MSLLSHNTFLYILLSSVRSGETGERENAANCDIMVNFNGSDFFTLQLTRLKTKNMQEMLSKSNELKCYEFCMNLYHSHHDKSRGNYKVVTSAWCLALPKSIIFRRCQIDNPGDSDFKQVFYSLILPWSQYKLTSWNTDVLDW